MNKSISYIYICIKIALRPKKMQVPKAVYINCYAKFHQIYFYILILFLLIRFLFHCFYIQAYIINIYTYIGNRYNNDSFLCQYQPISTLDLDNLDYIISIIKKNR